MKRIKSFFELDKYNTTVKIEIIAGITTFLAMAYILVVNPNNILWNGVSDPRWSSVFMATAIGSTIGTLLMALLAKMPFAQAPGMGINAIAGTIIGGGMGFSFSYGNTMMMVFISGIIFIILSFLPGGYSRVENKKVSLREKIFEGVPKAIRIAIPVGIGLFITYIGLQNAHLITSNEFTLTQLVDFNNKDLFLNGGPAACAIVSLIGLLVIAILSHYKVKGAIIFGILVSTIVSIPLGVANVDVLLGKTDGVSWEFWLNFKNYFTNNNVFLSLFKDGVNIPSGSFNTCVMLVLTFCMVDVFDTIGTIVGCSKNAGLLDKHGKPKNYSKIMYADSLSSVCGAVVGTSSVTTFVESGTGISAGGKTGLTALVIAILFFLSLFLLPVFAFIPSAAASSALIYVGVVMMGNVLDIDFKNPKYAIPSFLTILFMPFTYSITDGIGIGLLSFVILDLIIYLVDYMRFNEGCEKKPKLEINFITIIIAIMFLAYFVIPNF